MSVWLNIASLLHDGVVLFEENRVKKSRRSSGEGCDDASRSTDRDTSSWDSCNMWTTLARRLAVNSACRFNRVQLVAGSRTVNIIRLYIETLSEHYESWHCFLWTTECDVIHVPEPKSWTQGFEQWMDGVAEKQRTQWISLLRLYTLCSEKNTHSHFLSYLHEWCVDLNKNCREYT